MRAHEHAHIHTQLKDICLICSRNGIEHLHQSFYTLREPKQTMEIAYFNFIETKFQFNDTYTHTYMRAFTQQIEIFTSFFVVVGHVAVRCGMVCGAIEENV